MSTLKNIKLTNIVGGASCLGLFTLAFLTITPPITEGASAESVIDSSTIGFDVDAEQVMAIALTPTTTANVTPNAGGRFTSQDAAVTVSTNNLSGYELFMTTEDGTGNLKNMSVETDKVISSITSSTIGSAMPLNTWGYNLASGEVTSSDATTFATIPTTNTKVGGTNVLSDTGSDKYTLSFGAKVSTSIPAGVYSNRVVVSTVANAIEVSNLQNLTYMQDMTSSICENTLGTDHKPVVPGNEPTKRLIDSRDGNAYWVSKLADGNCWMTQSLAYDITGDRIESGAINPTNTDVSSVWNYASSSVTPPTVTETEVPNAETNIPQTTTRSWHLGGTKKYVLATPTSGITCGNNGTPAGSDNGTKNPSITDDGWNSVWTGGNLTSCKNLVDVTDTRVWTPTYTAENGNWTPTGATDTTIAVKPNNMNDFSQGGEYDAHYLLGNYYQWNAATAGSGGEIVSGGAEGNITPNNAKDSICPKGWELPKADGGAAEAKDIVRFTESYFNKYGNKTFSNLFNAYGYGFPNGGAPNIYGPNQQSGHNTVASPFYFSRSGNVSLLTGSLRCMGNRGVYWSSTASTSASNTYSLYFDSADTFPSNSLYRGYGFSIRCLSR